MKEIAVKAVSTADRPMDPAPTNAAPCREIRLPAMIRAMDPAKGRAGMSQSRSSISAPQPSCRVRVKGPEASEELEGQGQTH